MSEPFIIGWEEWVALPDLGLPAIKAKVDTGARTSALHAHLIEPFGPASAPMVRFAVHPVTGRTDIDVTCSAPIIDRREVTSSNGERENRYVIATQIRIGSHDWPVEITLTNRETMAYRMLIGRQAIKDGMFVDPASSFLQPRLSYKTYRKVSPQDVVRRPLRIGVLTRRPDAPSIIRLAAAARARGHVLETIGIAKLSLVLEGLMPVCRADGQDVPHYDVIIPRFGAKSGDFAIASLRQLELMGSVAINPASAIERLLHPLSVLQALAKNRIAASGPQIATEKDDPVFGTGAAGGLSHRYIVIGQNAVCDNKASGDDLLQRQTATRAAKALQLRLAAIGLQRIGDRVQVAGVSAFPSLKPSQTISGQPVSDAVIADAERQARSWVRHAAWRASES